MRRKNKMQDNGIYFLTDKLGFTGVGFCKNSVCCQMLILDSVGANCVRPPIIGCLIAYD